MNGTLISWFKHRNYGFIRPELTDDEIFCHITDLPNNEPLPKNTRVKFEIGNFGGRRKAINVEVAS
jgi:cold shock CspA family protein